MDHFRRELQAEEILKESAFIITDARRLASDSHYELTSHIWSDGCAGRQINPDNCPLTKVLDFLT